MYRLLEKSQNIWDKIYLVVVYNRTEVMKRRHVLKKMGNGAVIGSLAVNSVRRGSASQEKRESEDDLSDWGNRDDPELEPTNVRNRGGSFNESIDILVQPQHIGGNLVCTPGHNSYDDDELSAWPTVDCVYVDSENITPYYARDLACPLQTEFRYQVDRYLVCREIPHEDGGTITQDKFEMLLVENRSIAEACIDYAETNFEPMAHNLIHFILNPNDFIDTDSAGQNPTDNFHEANKDKPSVSWTGFHPSRSNFLDARIFMHETYHALLPNGYEHHALGDEYSWTNLDLVPARSVMQYDTSEYLNCCGESGSRRPPDGRTWNGVDAYVHSQNVIEALQYALDNYDWSKKTDGPHLVKDSLPDGCSECYE